MPEWPHRTLSFFVFFSDIKFCRLGNKITSDYEWRDLFNARCILNRTILIFTVSMFDTTELWNVPEGCTTYVHVVLIAGTRFCKWEIYTWLWKTLFAGSFPATMGLKIISALWRLFSCFLKMNFLDRVGRLIIIITMILFLCKFKSLIFFNLPRSNLNTLLSRYISSF